MTTAFAIEHLNHLNRALALIGRHRMRAYRRRDTAAYEAWLAATVPVRTSIRWYQKRVAELCEPWFTP